MELRLWKPTVPPLGLAKRHNPAMLPFHWLTQTIALGLGISFSPLNIALVALLLLGPNPLRRCSTLAAVVLVGSRFSWAMQLGSRGQVLMDLIGAGALVALGLFQLTPAAAIGEESWAMQLMGQLPELDWFPLLGLGAGCALIRCCQGSLSKHASASSYCRNAGGALWSSKLPLASFKPALS